MNAEAGYACGRCGQRHLGPPLAYGSPAPLSWHEMVEAERPRRALLSADQCILDGRRFFLAGNLDVPIRGREERFGWSAWVELSESAFERVCALWNTPGRELDPPCVGRLDTSLPGYPETAGLEVLVHTRAVGLRPFLELTSPDHPLSREQSNGIEPERIQDLAEDVIHGVVVRTPLAQIEIRLGPREDAETESFWARPLGGDLYQLRNVPWHAYDLNFGDVVRAEGELEAGERPRIAEVTRRSGHRTIRALLADGLGEGDEAGMLETLRGYGVTFERASAELVAIDVPPAGDYEGTCEQLWQWEQDGKLHFEVGSTDDLA